MHSLIINLVTIVILALSPGTPQDAPLSAEQTLAAKVAAGEVSAALFGGHAYAQVICTMINRVNHPDFPNTLTDVLDAYYAPPRSLTAQELRIAQDIFAPDTDCAVSDPLLYVLSAQDIARHGLPNGDTIYTYTLPSGAVLAAHFFHRSPWR